MKTTDSLYSDRLPLANARYIPSLVTMLVGKAGNPHRVFTRLFRTQRGFDRFLSQRFPTHTRVTVLHNWQMQGATLIRYRANDAGVLMGESEAKAV